MIDFEMAAKGLKPGNRGCDHCLRRRDNVMVVALTTMMMGGICCIAAAVC